MINNSTCDKNIHIQCKAKASAESDGPVKLGFQGYSGDAVDLSDYGFDHPVAYDIAGITYKNSIPILYNHSDAIGHTTSVRKMDNGTALRGKGIGSLPGPSLTKVVEGIKNGFPFEASMGLKADYESLEFHEKGVEVNGRKFSGPTYVFRNSKLREMTVTEFGRDSDTSFEYLNKEQLMTIKNAAKKADDKKTPPTDTKVDNKAPEGDKGDSKKADTTVDNKAPEGDNKAPEGDKVDNKAPEGGKVDNGQVHSSSFNADTLRALTLLNKHPEHFDAIKNGLERGLTDDQIENSIELSVMKSKLPPAPGRKELDAQNQELLVRNALAYGSSPEFLAKKYGEKVVDNADSQPMIGITETLVNVANSMGGRFNGHSDVENMCEFIKNAGYSTWDLPDFFKKVAENIKEERWEIGAPLAPSLCKEESNKDFNIHERRRISGGGIWNEVGADGKIDLYGDAKQKTYESKLQTYGALMTWTRTDVINDDQGALNDLMDAMVEGSMMIPDKQLGDLMLRQAAAANTFWVDTVNSFTSKTFGRANLSSQYKAIRRYNEEKDALNWNVMIQGGWYLVTGPDLEEEVFDILSQSTIVQETGAANGTKTGSRNYLYKKFEHKVFAQMGNTSAFGTGTFATDGTWVLWPKIARFAPYSINYLRGQKKPTIQAVQMPAELLGFGERGYWDVKINEREDTAIYRHKA